MISIIATIGPASSNIKTLQEMIKAGMNIARLNFSHGTHEAHVNLIKNIRKASKLSQANIPIIQDLSGPRIQGKTNAKTGSTAHSFKKGAKTFTPKDRADLLFGIKQKLDYVALSDIKDKNDILRIKEFLLDNNCNMPVIAKIETKQAIKNIKSIIKVAPANYYPVRDFYNAFNIFYCLFGFYFSNNRHIAIIIKQKFFNPQNIIFVFNIRERDIIQFLFYAE